METNNTEKTVFTIPPLPKGKKQGGEKPKLRVAAYCRVSTDTEEQATSYEAQIAHYTAYIGNHPEWTLAGVFADDGISGTNTRKRDEFNRMIDECMAGNIEIKCAYLIQGCNGCIHGCICTRII